MKRWLSIAAALLFTSKMVALPVGNPAAASLFCCDEVLVSCLSFDSVKLRIGFYGDYVFNRSLETVAKKHIDFSRVSTNAGLLRLNIAELFEIYTTLGASKFSLNTSLVAFNPLNPSPRFTFETSTAFSWSIGAQGTLWHYKCFYLGVTGQYFTSHPRSSVWFLPNLSARPNHDRSRYSEWQVGSGLAYRRSGYFIPYVALKWSRSLWEFNNQSLVVSSGGQPVATLINLQSSKELGGAVGLSLAPFECLNLTLTVEGRFGDESAVHINTQLFF